MVWQDYLNFLTIQVYGWGKVQCCMKILSLTMFC